MTTTTILSEDSVGLIRQYAASMELWEELQLSRVPLEFNQVQEPWEDQSERWKNNVRGAYTMCLRIMGACLSLELNPSYEIYDQMELLTGVAKWDKQIVKECFIAYIEMFQTAYHNLADYTMYSEAAASTFMDMADWRHEYRDVAPIIVSCEEIRQLNQIDYNDWRRQAIEEAVAEAILVDIRGWPVTPWGICHQDYVVVARGDSSTVLRAFRTLHDAEEYALLETRPFECYKYSIYRGRYGEEPEYVDPRWLLTRQLC